MGCFCIIMCCSFLVGFVVVGGVVVFGIYCVFVFIENFNEEEFVSGFVIFNFWVVIDFDKIILIVMYVDKGQGV